MSSLKIIFKRDYAITFTDLNPILREFELGREKDTNKFKIGDGVTPWNKLPYSTTLPEYIIISRTYNVGV